MLEGSDRVGGKLRLAEVDGVTLDVGAEAMLARRPEATDLCAEIGLGDAIVHPATIVGRHLDAGRAAADAAAPSWASRPTSTP